MDKKNTLLLTVIAIATLLVAVIGATFAYFSAQAGAGAHANVNVTTSTTDTATMGKFDDIKIDANQTNFSDSAEVGSLVDATKGYVSFTASNANQEEATYCYNVSVNISKNEFVYSLPKTFGSEEHTGNYPELVLNIWKKTENDNGLDSINVEANRYKKTIHIGDNQLTYYDSILDSTRICQADSNSSCEDSPKISGYDITVINNSSVESDLKTVSEIKIPKIADLGAENYDNDQTYDHEIKATGQGSTVYDKWYVEVIFVNYTDNDIYHEALQQPTDHYADQNLNTNKKFIATLDFTPCAED